MNVGVATAGYQVEGGFNAWGEPTNNWADWELRGRAEPSGVACRLWDRPDVILDRAAALGCDRFRLSIEWARVQPGFDIGDAAPPPYDETALDGYADLVSACRHRGMEPLITLHHFTHPRWIGLDLWGVPAKLPFFGDYVTTAVTGLNDRLAERGQRPVTEWVTINELNGLALGNLGGLFPAGTRRRLALALRSLDTLLTAHCLAYDRIHDIHDARGWPAPVVTTNNYALSTYRLDLGLTDLLLAREHDVARDDLGAWLDDRDRAHAYNRGAGVAGMAERALAVGTGALIKPGRLPFTIDAIYSSARPAKLDVLAVDWYDPVLGRHVRAPGRVVAGARRWRPVADLDEQVADPGAMVAWLHTIADRTPGKPVVMMENGLCSMWPAGGQARRRPDGLSRPEYVRSHCDALARAVDEGVPLTGYYHWTIVDNYEWGSYAPRFGVHAVERLRGDIAVLDRDAMGDDAAAAFRDVSARLGAA